MRELFDASRFMPRGQCGDWEPWVRSLYVSSNLLIFAAYLTIPIILTVALFSRLRSLDPLTKREHFRARVVYSAFILFCGVGHFEGVVSFAWPNYHLFAFWDLATAVVSWVAVVETFRLRAKIITGV